MLLPPLPRAAIPVDLIERDMPERFEVVVDRDFDPLRLVGDVQLRRRSPAIAMLALPEGKWHAFELWDERYLACCGTVARVRIG